MTTIFTSFDQVNLPASATTVYTSPALTVTHLLSVYFSNKTALQVDVTVNVVRSGGSPTVNLLTNAPIPVGSALDIIDNKPIVLNAGDYIQATASGASSIDVIGSVMQMS